MDNPGEGPPGDEFVVVDDEPAALDYEAPPRVDATDRPLDAVRVRQLSALRRGAYRSRSYCLIAASVCAAAAVQLAVMAVQHLRAVGGGLRPVGYFCGVVAAMMAGAFFARRAAELTRELRRPPDGPREPPDFSTLSDGSQAWKNLDQMNRGG